MSHPIPAPAWAKSLIIYQLHPDGFTPEGTWTAARRKLPYLSGLGITALWLTPVYEANTDPVYGCVPGRFCNFDVKEPDRLDPRYGTDEDFREFVAAAHTLSLRIFLEIVPHGVTFNSTLVRNHPVFFRHNEQGKIVGSWGMADFDFNCPAFQDYWVANAVHFVRDYGVDGFRCDLEPMISGYAVWERVRLACLEAGREIVLFSEMKNTREQAFLFEESGVGDRNDTQGSGDYLYEHSLVRTVREGRGLPAEGRARYYTFCMSNHDTYAYQLNLSPLRAGYELAFAPFIPVLYMGEEFGASAAAVRGQRNVLFFNRLSWDEQSRNQGFTEQLSSMLHIRHRYPHLFENFNCSLREQQLLPVESDAPLPAYARFGGGEAVVILGHPGACRPEWIPLSGSWSVEYGQFSQNQRDSLCAARLDLTLPDRVEIRLELEVKLDPDQDMGGFAGLLLLREGEELPDSRRGLLLGWNGVGRLFAYEDGRFLADRAADTSPLQGGVLTLSAAEGRLTARVGGQPLLEAAAGWRGGRLALITSRTHAHFRRVDVRADGQTLFADDFIGPDRTVTALLDTAAAQLKGDVFQVTDLLTGASYPAVAEGGALRLTHTLAGNTCAALHAAPITRL